MNSYEKLLKICICMNKVNSQTTDHNFLICMCHQIILNPKIFNQHVFLFCVCAISYKLAYKAIFSHWNDSKSKYAIKHIYNTFENKYSSISIGTFYLTNTGDIKTSKRLPKNELWTLYFQLNRELSRVLIKYEFMYNMYNFYVNFPIHHFLF